MTATPSPRPATRTPSATARGRRTGRARCALSALLVVACLAAGASVISSASPDTGDKAVAGTATTRVTWPVIGTVNTSLRGSSWALPATTARVTPSSLARGSSWS